MNTTIQGHNAVGGATKRGAPDPTLVGSRKGESGWQTRADALIEQARQAKVANEAAGGNELVKPLIPAKSAVTRRSSPATSIQTTRTRRSLVIPTIRGSQQPPQHLPRPSAPNPPPAPPPAPPQHERDWEHQFKSLKGRYDREQEDKRRLQQTLQDQQRLLAQVGPPASPTPPGRRGSGLRFDVRAPSSRSKGYPRRSCGVWPRTYGRDGATSRRGL